MRLDCDVNLKGRAVRVRAFNCSSQLKEKSCAGRNESCDESKIRVTQTENPNKLDIKDIYHSDDGVILYVNNV